LETVQLSAADASAGAVPVWSESDARVPRRRRPLIAFTRQNVVEGLWVLFLFFAYNAEIPRLGNFSREAWMAVDLAMLAYFVRDPQPFVSQALAHKLIMSWPAMAILSTLWSLSPTTSLYHGVQLAMTILAAFLMVHQLPRQRIVVVVFLALTICMLGSMGYAIADFRGRTQGVWNGLFTHKNELGGAMAALIVTGTCLFLMGWRPLFSLAVTVLAVATLAKSRSGSAILVTGLTLCPIVLAYSLRQGRNVLSFGIGILILAGVGIVSWIVFSHVDVVELVLNDLGKDRTLSGRTQLWSFGIDAFTQHPWLGHGYKGYWENPQTSVEYLRYVIKQRLWFFHNNFIEAAVAFGIMGPILLLAGIVGGYITTIKTFLRERTYTALWCVLIVIYVSLYTLSENPLIANHSIWQLLLVVAIAAAMQRPPAPPARSSKQDARAPARSRS
jgi:O-antigen ligase